MSLRRMVRPSPGLHADIMVLIRVLRQAVGRSYGGPEAYASFCASHDAVVRNIGRAAWITRFVTSEVREEDHGKSLHIWTQCSCSRYDKFSVTHRVSASSRYARVAINIMAIFVHNEPTCLPVIQETGLPEVFYGIIEKGLEPIIEVIQSIPNAIGALCLNQAGQDQLTARPHTIPSLFSIFTSEDHQRVLQEKENAVLIGTSIEELIRHHPTLKDKVFSAIKSTMTKITDLGNAYVVPDDIKQYYKLQPQSPAPAAQASTETSTAMDVDQPNVTEQPETPAAAAQAAAAEQPAHRDDFPGRSHDNIVISYIDVFGKASDRELHHDR